MCIRRAVNLCPRLRHEAKTLVSCTQVLHHAYCEPHSDCIPGVQLWPIWQPQGPPTLWSRLLLKVHETQLVVTSKYALGWPRASLKNLQASGANSEGHQYNQTHISLTRKQANCRTKQELPHRCSSGAQLDAGPAACPAPCLPPHLPNPPQPCWHHPALRLFSSAFGTTPVSVSGKTKNIAKACGFLVFWLLLQAACKETLQSKAPGHGHQVHWGSSGPSVRVGTRCSHLLLAEALQGT